MAVAEAAASPLGGGIPSFADAGKSFDFGEGASHPVSASGACAHALLVPTGSNRSSCALPGRADTLLHRVRTGGLDGMWARPRALLGPELHVFQRHDFSTQQAGFDALLDSATFASAARAGCPADAQVLDASERVLTVTLPGRRRRSTSTRPGFGAARRALRCPCGCWR